MINGYANSNNKNTYKGSSRTPAFVLLAYPTYCSPFFIGNDMVDKKEYYKQWYERNRECRIEYARKWSAENKKQVKKNRKQWYERNKEKQKEYSKKWYTENKERVKGNTRRWQKENKDKFEEWRRKWDKKNPEKRKIIRRKNKSKRRQFGFIPLNKHFEGSHGHHINKEQVIYMPAEIHNKIYHSVLKNINMDKINEIAFNFLDQQRRLKWQKLVLLAIYIFVQRSWQI